MNESGRTALPVALKNSLAGRERGGFTAGSARIQAPARPKTPFGAKSTCPAAKFSRSSRQAARHLGYVGLDIEVSVGKEWKVTDEEINEIRSRYETILPLDEAKKFVERKKICAAKAESEAREYIANGLANGTLERDSNGWIVERKRPGRPRRTLSEIDRDIVAGKRPNSIWTIGR